MSTTRETSSASVKSKSSDKLDKVQKAATCEHSSGSKTSSIITKAKADENKLRSPCDSTSSVTAVPDRFYAGQSFSTNVSSNSWESWLLQKELEFRSRLQQQINQKMLERENATKQNLDKQKKKQLAETVYHDWAETKMEIYKRKKIKAKRKERQKKAIIDAENKKKRERAEIEYNQWLQEKRNYETEIKRKEEECQKEQEEKDRAKKEKAAAAFNTWLKRNPKKCVPPPAPVDYEIDIDKLIGRVLL